MSCGIISQFVRYYMYYSSRNINAVIIYKCKVLVLVVKLMVVLLDTLQYVAVVSLLEVITAIY